MFHFVLQKPSPNACPVPKVKVKSSPMIEKLQVSPVRVLMAIPANPNFLAFTRATSLVRQHKGR